MNAKVATACLLAACAAGLNAESVSEPADETASDTRGRVFGMYSLHPTQSPAPTFPFRAQYEVCTRSTATSAADGFPSTANLDADDLASLPANAFIRTGYVHPGSQKDDEFSVFVARNLTPGTVYRMDVYLNEPYHGQDGKRSQKVWINGEYLKNADGTDLVVSPFAVCGGKLVVGKTSYEVEATEEGEISFAFPRVLDQSAINVVTLAGPHLPAAAAAPAFKAAGGADEISLAWPAARDAFAYYVQRKTGEADWETVGETIGTNAVVALAASDLVQSYRIVSSNGLGMVAGEAATYGTRRRARYAVSVAATAVVGRFVPAGVALVSNVQADSYSAAPTGVEGRYVAEMDVYKTYGLGYGGAMSFAFSNLTAEAEYDFRIHFLEGNSSASASAARLIDVSTNGALAATWDALAAAGFKRGGVGYFDFTAAADADGTLAIDLARNAASTLGGLPVCAVEVFARADEPFEAVVPTAGLTAFAEGVRIVPETRHAQDVYEIRFVDAEDAPDAEAEGALLAQNVPQSGFFDFEIPETGARWYRVRAVAADGAAGAWSPWMRGARGERSFSSALRVNFTQNFSDQTPEGWVTDEPFRSGHVGGFTQSPGSLTQYDVEQNVIVDQAPDFVYKTGIMSRPEVADKVTYRFVFPGFDSGRKYRLRLHLLEHWDGAKIGTRVFHLAVNRAAPSALQSIDAMKLADGILYRPSVAEDVVSPMADGTIRIDFVRASENPTPRGVEFIPVDGEGETFGTGRVAFMRDAGSSAVDGTNETFVAEADASPLEWSWTADDLPAEAGDKPRVLAHGRLYFPCADTVTAAVTASGTVNLWMDGQVFSANKATAVSAGAHDVYVTYQPTNRAACAMSLVWQTASGGVPRSLRADAALSYPEGWRFTQIGSRYSPGYVCGLPNGSWRMMASGSDLWGASDCGTFFYRAAGRAPFDCSFRVMGIGGVLAGHSRLGVMVRSSLKSAQADSFMLYAGIRGDKSDLRSYVDATPDDGTFNIVNGFIVPTGACSQFPFTIRATRERVGMDDRFVVSFTSADGALVHAATQQIARAANVYVGPVAVAHSSVGSSLAHYEFTDLAFEDTTPRALVIIVR